MWPVRSRRRCSRIGVELADRQDGNWTSANDFLGDASQKQSVFAVSSSRANGHNICIDLPGILDDFRGGTTGSHGRRNLPVGNRTHVVEGRIASFGQRFSKGFTNVFGCRGDVILGNDVQCMNLGAKASGQIGSHSDRPRDALRAVGRNNDRFDHAVPFHRDSHKHRGRGLFHAARPSRLMNTAAVTTVLVGVDASDEAVTAADYALAIAAKYDAELVALHVVDSTDYRAMSSGEREPAMISADGEAVLADIAAKGEAEGVEVRGATAYGFDVHRKLVHPGSVVLDTAEEIGADFIVLPREPLEGTEGTLAKSAEYALLYASQPVLAV